MLSVQSVMPQYVCVFVLVEGKGGVCAGSCSKDLAVVVDRCCVQGWGCGRDWKSRWTRDWRPRGGAGLVLQNGGKNTNREVGQVLGRDLDLDL